MNDQLHAALYSIPPEDRDLWVRMGMAVKAALGDAGFALWDGWSRQSDRYRERDARAALRSFKDRPDGIGIGVGSLYAEARRQGWAGEAPVRPTLSAAEHRRRAEAAARQRAQDARRAAEAAATAQDMIDRAEFATHPYLARKGFPDEHGLVLGEMLLVPMRDVRTGALLNVQRIWADGTKKYLAGGRAKGAVYRFGRAAVRCYCEGLATALSTKAALIHLYRRDQVVVCFSDHNLAHVARRGGYAVADHDASGAGEAAAKQTGLPYWMPPEPGNDANDWHQQHGIEALAAGLREVLHGGGLA